MREEKIARSISGALTVLLIAFAALTLIWGLDFARQALFYGLGCTLTGIAAGWVLGRRHALLQLLASALPAAALALAVGISIPGAEFARYILMGAGALLAVWAERQSVASRDAPLNNGLLLAPFAALLGVSAVLWFSSHAEGSPAFGGWTLLLSIGSVWFVATVLLLNRIAFRQAARAESQRGIPAAVRRSGTAGALIFLLAAFVLANIGDIAGFVGNIIKTLIAWIVKAYLFLASLFPGGSPAQTPIPTNTPGILPPAEGGSSPFMEFLSYVAIAAVLLAVAAGIVYGLYRLLPKLWKKLRERLARLFASWRTEEEGFSDRAESLMNLRQALSNAGARLRKFARRLRRRPRIGDYPTNIGKARFLFREYLRGLAASGRAPAQAATAAEIAHGSPALASAYNLARYGEEEPSDMDIEKAKESFRISP
jgi:uncharacterized protein YjeT (DUF2065 family)